MVFCILTIFRLSGPPEGLSIILRVFAPTIRRFVTFPKIKCDAGEVAWLMRSRRKISQCSTQVPIKIYSVTPIQYNLHFWIAFIGTFPLIYNLSDYKEVQILPLFLVTNIYVMSSVKFLNIWFHTLVPLKAATRVQILIWLAEFVSEKTLGD